MQHLKKVRSAFFHGLFNPGGGGGGGGGGGRSETTVVKTSLEFRV